MEIKKLNERYYDELLDLMNGVFTRKDKKPKDFAKDYPKMAARDNEHMQKYFGGFEEGKLVASIGVYPLETTVCGEKFLFATTGNIATHWEHEGKGYMGKMIDRAMEALDEMHVDVARLGGLRSRYNRYGFEACGQKISFLFTQKNRTAKLPNVCTDITFSEIDEKDEVALKSAIDFYNKNEVAVTRNLKNVYACMTTLRFKPYLAKKQGRAVGYLCVNESRSVIAEAFAENAETFVELICSWQQQNEVDLSFSLPPYKVEEIRVFTAVCEQVGLTSPSHFFIRNWEKVCSAFLRLKQSYCPLPQGELIIQIKDYATIRLFVNEEGAGCERTDKAPDVVLDRLEAARYIFGPHSPINTQKANGLAMAWFPLPLGWNGQDRL